jgi:asparagine synthase (glutamine-hydrolysing)
MLIGAGCLAVIMSGIAAIYRLDGMPVEDAILDRLLTSIAHRGPDRIGRWINGPVALGHAMLRTTPESVRETQPLCDENAELWLTLDGRIDNREELTAALTASGVHLRSDTDAELVLRAYDCWGEECPPRIIGDFAFALWDGRKRQLFCARDPGGIKPFYYYFDGRMFVCGSELQQILETPGLSLEPNEGFIGEYLCGKSINREETLFQGVSRLTPAHWLRASANGIAQRGYFDFNPGSELRYRSDEEYQAHYREILAQAVRSAMRCSDGVAAELSGGMDSSSVVCMAQVLLREGRVQNQRFESFSLVYPDTDYDERAYIDDVVAMWGLSANFVTPSPGRARALPERAALHKDLAGYPNGIVYDELKSLIAKKGFRVCLTGFGGDQWFTGSPRYYADLIRELKLRELWEDLRINWRFGEPDASRLQNLLRYGLWPLLPSIVQRGVKRASGIGEIPRWLKPEFARRISLVERIRRNTAYPVGLTFAQQTVYEVFARGWSTHAFELEDRDTARFGLEPRHPLCDRRLLEFAFALPDDQRFRGRFTKFIMREAMRNLIPASVRERVDKSDLRKFSVDMLRQLSGEHGFELPMMACMGWVDAVQLSAMCRDGLPVGDGTAMWSLWRMLNVELWLRAIFPGDRPALARAHLSV